MKTCSKCKIEKGEADFPKDKSQSDGLKCRCKDCWREYRQTDAYKEYRKAYRQTDVYKKSQEKHQQTDTFKTYQKKYQRESYRRKKAAAAAGNAAQPTDTQTLGAKE